MQPLPASYHTNTYVYRSQTRRRRCEEAPELRGVAGGGGAVAVTPMLAERKSAGSAAGGLGSTASCRRLSSHPLPPPAATLVAAVHTASSRALAAPARRWAPQPTGVNAKALALLQALSHTSRPGSSSRANEFSSDCVANKTGQFSN